MSDSDEDTVYSNGYHSRSYVESSRNVKLPSYPRADISRYANEYHEEDDEDDDEGDVHGDYGYRNDGVYSNGQSSNGYHDLTEENGHFERHPKRQKSKNVEFSGRMLNAGIGDWSDQATFVLLEVWGEKFMQLERRSLRSEDWDEVAERVSEATGIYRTEEQCRNRMDVLKKRYKKEKERVEKMGFGSSKWMFFRKMDTLMGLSRGPEGGLTCGIDSGEYVFLDTRVYLDRSNGLDEMRDSPTRSEMLENGEDEEENVEAGLGGAGGEEEESMRMLADSVMKFGEVYEKVEDRRVKEMMELEKIRMDCRMELEMQKKQIMDRAEAEIARIREMDDEVSDSSSDSLSA